MVYKKMKRYTIIDNERDVEYSSSHWQLQLTFFLLSLGAMSVGIWIGVNWM